MQNEVVIGGESLFNGNKIGEVDLNTQVSGVSIADDIIVGGEMSINDNVDGSPEMDTMMSGQSETVLTNYKDGEGEGTSHHDELDHREYPNQHPIAAIQGLQSALNAKVNTADIGIIYCGTATEVI